MSDTRRSWLRRRAEDLASVTVSTHKKIGTPIDIVDIADAIENVAREFADRSASQALTYFLGDKWPKKFHDKRDEFVATCIAAAEMDDK